MKRISIPDAETFIAAIQDEISRTKEGRYFHLRPQRCQPLRCGTAFQALNLKTGGLLTTKAPTFSAETFGDFVRYLLQSTHGKLYLILNNARWHKARELRDFFEANRDRVVRIFLPPYSPELNPVERVWRITRRQVTHNRCFQSAKNSKSP